MTLGEKLKKARINKNFTQEYLAEVLNVSQKPIPILRTIKVSLLFLR
ncbi:hypothetical protein [Chryseobacterium sp.]|nr:hypothetical protein [Chryseobacterium sp.]